MRSTSHIAALVFLGIGVALAATVAEAGTVDRAAPDGPTDRRLTTQQAIALEVHRALRAVGGPGGLRALYALHAALS
jgi:hypothetical protein